MEKLTAEQLVDVLERSKITPFFLAEETFDGDEEDEDEEGEESDEMDRDEKAAAVIESLGKVTEVWDEGGTDGTELVKVYHFEDHDVFIRIKGWYSSYEGSSWEDDFEIVSPRRVIKTIYETEEERGDQTDEA